MTQELSEAEAVPVWAVVGTDDDEGALYGVFASPELTQEHADEFDDGTVTVQREPVIGSELDRRAGARKLIVSILADLDYNDGGMMRWHPSGEPTERAEAVATRIVRELAPFLAKESHS